MIKLRAGFVQLVDAAVLIAAADRGFAEAEGVNLELVREVSWSNVRDKLNLGHYEAAHMLAPLAIAESLGLDYARVPLTSLLVMNQNGNSILFGNETYAALLEHAQGDLDDPAVSGAALKKLIEARAKAGEEPLTFSMTFPFSSHNYLLRFWTAAAGIDPDEDIRLVVLPPPYMVDSLKNGHVHGFCVGAPWPSMAVEAGIGRIVHFGSDILATCSEKVLAVRSAWAAENRDSALALTRALIRSTVWCATPENRVELAHILAAPSRMNLSPDLILRALEGRLRMDANGRIRENAQYLVLSSAAARPDVRQGLWLYAQMVRWNQAEFSSSHMDAVNACLSPELFDAALCTMARKTVLDDGIGAFSGPAFDPTDIPAYLAALDPK
ncbi:CmpA/NrtA family ABC transporter substrate-binding protein [Flaviflagellibacter deserti]|uniref:CmpA/NrtA family ABC transporter substrate-binding protein n=1 Tax=Flaviflagellibacter deserti TaxID=2267266 RepID=A0ABV9Z458_9HYPH